MFPAEIMEEVRQLSPGALWTGVGIAVVFLLFGYQLYKFWIVLGSTVASGFIGLNQGPIWGVHPVVGAVMAGLAGGILSLSLFRLFAFLSGGAALALVTGLVTPGPGELLVLFVVGGLIALLLERLWMALASSFLGAWLLGYALLGLLDRGQKIDALKWIEENHNLLPVLVGTGTLLGAGAQYWIYRWTHVRNPQYNDLGQPIQGMPSGKYPAHYSGSGWGNTLGRWGRH
jgi:hypothetical protein